MTGKIDRLCELDDVTWIMIDYKNEGPSDNAALERYAVSLSVYIKAAGRLLGSRFWGVYFTKTGCVFNGEKTKKCPSIENQLS